MTGGKFLWATAVNSRSAAVARGDRIRFAVRFNSGSSIGRNSKVSFGAAGPLMTSYHAGSQGPWVNSHGYLGLAIKIEGQIHYGWARLNVQGASALLTGYAYETVANKPIRAGQARGDSESRALLHSQGSLGVLALGSRGLALWRRQDSISEGR